MGIIDWFKKWFFNETQIGIINIGNLIQIPGREYFKDRKDILESIDEYKGIYLTTLSQKKKVLTIELSNKELNEKKDMYIKLLLNIVMNEEKDESKSMNLLDNKIILLKLKLYLEEIKKIEDETIARLIALKELEKGKRVPHRNRDTINNEINNLSTSLYVLLNQKMAIKIEIENYLNNVSISDSKILIKHVGDRKFETIRYASLVMNVENIIKEEELNTIIIPKQIAIIALLEIELEKFIYKNSFDFNRYITTVNQIGYMPELDYEEAKKIKEELIIELGKLENIYKLYYKYGRNQINEEDFYHLYSAYFKILTFDLLEDTFNKNFYTLECCDDDSIEYKMYERILFEKKQKILKGENEVISNIFGPSSNKFIKLLSNYFKEDSKKSEFYGTPIFHHSTDAIRLILALDSIENLNRLLNSKINRANLPVISCFEELFIDDLLIVKKDSQINDNHPKQFTFAPEIPLSTVLEVMDIRKEVPGFYKCLYEIYNKIKDNSTGFTYYLPEGIVEINTSEYPFGYYAEKIRKEVKDKIVYMPSSLEKIHGNLFRFTGLSDIRLNEGIKSIGWYSLSSRKNNIAVFDVPSTLECCDGTSVNLTGSDYLRFNNYKESKLLYNSEQLGNLIKRELTGKVLNYIYNGKDRIDVDVEVIPKTLSKILLIENDHIFKTIRIDDIKCYGKITDMRTKEVEYPVSNEIAGRYAKKIIKKIEYEIKKTEKENKIIEERKNKVKTMSK